MHAFKKAYTQRCTVKVKTTGAKTPLVALRKSDTRLPRQFGGGAFVSGTDGYIHDTGRLSVLGFSLANHRDPSYLSRAPTFSIYGDKRASYFR